MADTPHDAAIPPYLKNAVPVPMDKRAPWYLNTAPTYAGIFLWFAFYQELGNTLRFGSIWSVLLGALLAGLVCHLFFYYVPGMLGLKTGMPLYIVGTSAFGVKGGYFIPGIFMGVLQIGWYSVATYFATKLVLGGLGLPDSGTNFYILAVFWGLLFAFIGALGIGYVAKIAQFFPIVPVAMLLIGAVQAAPHIASFQAPEPLPGEQFDPDYVSIASLLMIQLVVGFFGTAGAVGTDFCANNRNSKDVQYAGLTGIFSAVCFAAGLACLTVAGAHGQTKALLDAPEKMQIETTNGNHEAFLVVAGNKPEIRSLDGDVVKNTWEGMTDAEQDAVRKLRKQRFEYGSALTSLNTTREAGQEDRKNWLAGTMLLLFAIGSMAPACFCSFIIGNSLSTMLGRPGSRIPITLAGAGIGIAIALTGIPANLAPIFNLVGASFGPVIGAMIADYLIAGGRWSGPREGVNWAGYGAWLAGFLVGISNNSVVTGLLQQVTGNDHFEILAAWHPTGVYSLIVGLIAYFVIARWVGLPARMEGAVPTVGPKE